MDLDLFVKYNTLIDPIISKLQPKVILYFLIIIWLNV